MGDPPVALAGREDAGVYLGGERSPAAAAAPDRRREPGRGEPSRVRRRPFRPTGPGSSPSRPGGWKSCRRWVASPESWPRRQNGGTGRPTAGPSSIPRETRCGFRRLDSSRGTPIATGRDLHSPSWSSDGRWIAYVEGKSLFHRNGNLGASGIRVVSSRGGTPVGVTQGQRTQHQPDLAAGPPRPPVHIRPRGRPGHLRGGADVRGVPRGDPGPAHHRPRRRRDHHLVRRPAAGLVPVPGNRQCLVAADSGQRLDSALPGHPGHHRDPEYRKPRRLTRWRVALLRLGSRRQHRTSTAGDSPAGRPNN